MLVVAPASSANLGPGFDCLGLALDLPFELTATRPDAEFLVAESTHPAMGAFVAAGGDPSVTLHWRSPIPPGRGLGFSGAARVAGAHLAGRLDGLDESVARAGAFRIAAQLEGHPDNAAASAYGSFTVAVDEQVVTLRVPDGVQVAVWWPEQSTSTDASRRVLPAEVPLRDAAFSGARAALWVAAVASGELGLIRTACQDRLHQPGRLAARPDAASVIEHLLGDERVLGAWLSGSGPTVAALLGAEAVTDDVLAGLPVPGRTRVLGVAAGGVRADS